MYRFDFFFYVFFRRLRYFIRFRARGYLGRNSRILCFGNLDLGRNVQIGSNVKITIARGGRLIIGDNSYIGDQCQFEVEGLVSIGADVTISDNVFLGDVTHTWPLVSSAGFRDKLRLDSVEIGTGTWIGRNVTVNPGISIGPFNIVAANSVVTKGFPEAGYLLAGVPALPIKKVLS